MLVKKAEEIFQQPLAQSDQRDGQPPPSKRKRPQFMKDRSGTSRQTGGALSEVIEYLSHSCSHDEEDIHVLGFWRDNVNKYPTLAKLASTYLALPASSAPVERIFSIGGKVFQPDCCSLTDKTFESLMFIRCN